MYGPFNPFDLDFNGKVDGIDFLIWNDLMGEDDTFSRHRSYKEEPEEEEDGEEDPDDDYDEEDSDDDGFVEEEDGF